MDKMLNHEQQKIAEWLRTVKFRKQMIGGISEQDVWQKIEQLNEMYEKALSAERARYDTLLAKQRKPSSLKPGTPKSEHRRKGEL